MRLLGRASGALVSAAWLGAAFAACNGAPKDAPAAASSAKTGGKGRGGIQFAVDVLPVESKQVDYEVLAPGTVEAFEHVQVTARVAGAVDKVLFTEGQDVKAGDTLVRIDSKRFAVTVGSAEAAVAKAKAQEAASAAMLARRTAASDTHPGLIPAEEIATYQTQTLTTKADTAVAEENLHTAMLNLEDSNAKAPIDGVIQTRTVETGQYVQPGTVMATLLRVDPLLLRFHVEPGEAPRIKPGAIARFTMRETQRQYSATISLVSQSADPTTHMVAITGNVVNEGHNFWLRPGSFCDVSLVIGASRDAPLIPRTAARATDHGYVAYVVQGDVAHERVLALGMNTKDGWIEVRSGVSAGDLLVVHGAEALSDGAKVKPNTVTASAIVMGDAGIPPLGDGGLGGVTSASDAGARHRAPGDGGAPP